MYKGIGIESGTIVEESQAFEYALERCLHGSIDEQKEFKDMLVEWYFSGSWIKMEDDEDDK